MTRIHTIAAAAALAFSFVAGAAHAQDAIPATWANEQVKPFVSTVSRAQVLAELQAARQSGEVNALAQVREGAANVATTTGAKTDGGLTRAQVRAELDAARRSGELNPFDNLSDLQPVAHRAVVAPAAVASR